MVMVNMGLLSGVAGMVFTAYLNAANPKDSVEFQGRGTLVDAYSYLGRHMRELLFGSTTERILSHCEANVILQS